MATRIKNCINCGNACKYTENGNWIGVGCLEDANVFYEIWEAPQFDGTCTKYKEINTNDSKNRG